MTGNRICPSCLEHTDEAICPQDGFNTVDADRYDDGRRHIGRVFDGRYQVESLLGTGGMGTVYRCTQLSVNRPVALKILKPQYAADLDQVRRFQTEARAASRLDHPNTIRVFDFGQSEAEELYLVTELLEGSTLADVLYLEGRLDPVRSLTIGIQILKSLAEAHDEGIIHRDLKPENIFLKDVHGEADFVKVLDFGIAKVAARQGKSITTTGTVVGTPLYMSPEQASGRPIAVSSDIYSVGAVLYELLSGRPPFDGDTAVAIMMAHIQSSLQPLNLGNREWQRALSSVVSQCLEKSPDLRPGGASQLRLALEDILEEAQWDDGDDSVAPSVSQDALAVAQTETRRPAPSRPVTRDTSTPAALTMEAAQVAGLGRGRAVGWLAGAVVLVGLVGWALSSLWSQAPESEVTAEASPTTAPAVTAGAPTPAVVAVPAAVTALEPAITGRETANEVMVLRRSLATVLPTPIRRVAPRRRAQPKPPDTLNVIKH